MRSSIHLGRIAGIDIGVNWTWSIAFALIAWSLGTGVFPSTNPDLSRGAYAAMAIVAAVCFFGSLLLHELGHALQAQREHVRIEGITLWLFGGVAKLGAGFPSAAAEFRIAVAGPLVSLALGGAFVGLSAGAPLPDALDGVVAWLGYANLILLVFNLAPALPLDGGRVLRSLLWLRWRDFRRATLAAVRISRALSLLLILGGLLLLVFQGAYSGLWLAFIGWFLRQAAAQEERAANSTPPDVLVRSLTGATAFPLVVDSRVVAQAILRPVSGEPVGTLPRVDASASLVGAYREITTAGESRAFVLDDGRLVGVLEFAHAFPSLPSLASLLRALSFRSPRL